LSNKSTDKPKREYTRRQISHWKKEAKIRRIVTITAAVVIAAVIIAVGIGIYLEKVQPYNETVIKAGDKQYSMDYYIDTLAYYGSMYGSPEYIPYLTQTAAQGIAHNRFIITEAAEMGITVSDEEVQEVLEERELTSKKPVKDMIEATLALEKVREHFDSEELPVVAEHREVQVMLLESQSQAESVKSRLESGESFTELAKELSLNSYTKQLGGEIGLIPKGIIPTVMGNSENTVLDEAIFADDVAEDSLFIVEDAERGKVTGYWLLKVTETQETEEGDTEVYLYAMLLGSEDEAIEVKSKLGTSEEDFISLAKEYSQLQDAASNGGEFGFLTEQEIIDNDGLGSTLAGNIFNEDGSPAVELNTVIGPIKDSEMITTGGYWVVNVKNIEQDVEISEEHRPILLDNMIDEWATQVWEDNQDTFENLMDTEQITFAYMEAMER
jgi:parvulin-like peptidyl-prolyl isomerase